MSETPNLGLPLLDPEQEQKHVTHNTALRALDAVVQLSVKDRHLSAPPASPAEGDRYIVAAGATGAWAGHEGEIALRQDGVWVFLQPSPGWTGWLDDEAVLAYFTSGSVWDTVSVDTAALQEVGLLGIGTSADASNPFSAKLNAALWTAKTVAEGGDGDLRYTLSKATLTDTVSLLLQTNYSGRAEFRLTGNDDLSIKVSSNGAAWTTGLVMDRATGLISLAGNPAAALGAATKRYVDALVGSRNKLINARFAVNQRGAVSGAALAPGAYFLDRFKAGAGGATVSWATVNGVTTLTISAGTVQQVIEGASIESGEYQLSWAGTAQGRINAGAYGGSGSVGAALPGGVNATVEWGTGTLIEPQLERDFVTPFATKPTGEELDLCQRYFLALGGDRPFGFIGLNQCLSATAAIALVHFPTTMRGNPSLSYSNLAHWFLSNATGGGLAPTAITLEHAGTKSTSVRVIVASGLVAGDAAIFYAANSVLARLYFSAEL